jgi:hypothetical protein
MNYSKHILIGILLLGFSSANAQVLDSTLHSINRLYALWEKGYAQSKEQAIWSDFKVAEASWLSRFNWSIDLARDNDLAYHLSSFSMYL